MALSPTSLLVVAGIAVAYFIIIPLSLAYVVTHTARGFVPAADLGAAYEEVSFKTSDGLTLEGWYIPSKNRAAVIAFPGRAGSQRPARLLARTATASFSSTGVAKARATGIPTPSAGKASGTSTRQSPTCSSGRT